MQQIAHLNLRNKSHLTTDLLPAGLNHQQHPILCRHWFGVSPDEFHLRRQVERWLLEKRVRRSLLGQIPVQSRSRRSNSPRLLASAGT